MSLLAAHVDDAMLIALTVMLDTVSFSVSTPHYLQIRRTFRDEMTRRGFPLGGSLYEPTEESTMPIDLSDESDEEVRIWYALGAEIADYSCIGKGFRPYVNRLWDTGTAELKRRGIEMQFFCDF